jgi:hypothetical protein
MNVEEIPIKDLSFYEGNPRFMRKDELEQLKKNLQRFGCVDPLIIDEENVVLGGNQRLKAATELSWEKLPCVRLKGLSRTEKKALVVSLNRIGGNWDEALLRDLLRDITNTDVSLEEFTGFTEQELAGYIAESAGDYSLLDTSFQAGKTPVFIEELFMTADEYQTFEKFIKAKRLDKYKTLFEGMTEENQYKFKETLQVFSGLARKTRRLEAALIELMRRND